MTAAVQNHKKLLARAEFMLRFYTLKEDADFRFSDRQVLGCGLYGDDTRVMMTDRYGARLLFFDPELKGVAESVLEMITRRENLQIADITCLGSDLLVSDIANMMIYRLDAKGMYLGPWLAEEVRRELDSSFTICKGYEGYYLLDSAGQVVYHLADNGQVIGKGKTMRGGGLEFNRLFCEVGQKKIYVCSPGGEVWIIDSEKLTCRERYIRLEDYAKVGRVTDFLVEKNDVFFVDGIAGRLVKTNLNGASFIWTNTTGNLLRMWKRGSRLYLSSAPSDRCMGRVVLLRV